MKVECQVCGKRLKAITWLHLYMHNLTTKQYKEKYPGAPLWSKEARASLKVPHPGSGPKGPNITSFKKNDPRLLGENNPNYGGLSKEHRAKVSKSITEKYRRDPNYRQSVSKGTKEGMKKHKGYLRRHEQYVEEECENLERGGYRVIPISHSFLKPDAIAIKGDCKILAVEIELRKEPDYSKWDGSNLFDDVIWIKRGRKR